jgi:hypothetical protein
MLMTDATDIVAQIESGETRAADQLLSRFYGELRKLAVSKLAQREAGAEAAGDGLGP